MNLYKCKGFYLSSFLLSAGCNLIDTPVSSGITTFIFEDSEILNKLIKEFYNLHVTVEPTKYANAIKTLESILHASKANSKDNRYISQQRSKR